MSVVTEDEKTDSTASNPTEEYRQRVRRLIEEQRETLDRLA